MNFIQQKVRMLGCDEDDEDDEEANFDIIVSDFKCFSEAQRLSSSQIGVLAPPTLVSVINQLEVKAFSWLLWAR